MKGFKKMNKNQLAHLVSRDANLPQRDITHILSLVFEKIGDALSRKENVSISDFGTFNPTMRAVRKGRNPQTGAKIDIPQKTVAKFKPGKALRNKVNN
jgi:DNA-binding protein HU-beta